MDHVVPVIRGGKSIKAIALFAVKAAIIRKISYTCRNYFERARRSEQI